MCHNVFTAYFETILYANFEVKTVYYITYLTYLWFINHQLMQNKMLSAAVTNYIQSVDNLYSLIYVHNLVRRRFKQNISYTILRKY